jgi:cytidylate kinase
MALITISRRSYSQGKEIAKKVAKKLGYDCIARDIVLEASKEFNIPEIKLEQAIHDAPSIMDRFTYGKERYLTYLQIALLEHFQKDNVVYHGLEGHFLLRELPHLLKVLIISDMDDRIQLKMERKKISRELAERTLNNDDVERKKWSKYLYHINTWNPSLYDLVLHTRKVTVDDAVNIICHTVGLEHFLTTPESQKKIDDLLVAARVKAALIDLKPDIEVSANNGTISIETTSNLLQEEELLYRMEKTAKSIVSDKKIEITVHPVVTV